GPLTIRNRAVMSPMGTDFANPDGTASMRLIRYYQERARGGTGLIINEYTGVDHVDSIPSPHNLRISADFHIASLEMLTDAVHAYGAHIFAQIHHGGSTSKPALTGRQSLSASAMPIAPGAPVPRAMTLEEIASVQQKFIDAAVRCKKAGYDGIELHGAHSYLIGQFFSPYYNKRTDAYGGSFENRMRFIAEIIRGIRAALGKRFPISVRINGDEMTPQIPDTLTLEDGLEIGRYLEAQGIDVLNVSNGSALNGNANCDPYSYTPGWKKHVARAFKEALKIPIIATNTIKDPAFAEQMLEEGVCDFVGLGRSQIADPDFVRKAKEGREDEIRQCIGCMVCRERLLAKGLSVVCAINPRMGREHLYPEYRKDGGKRPVCVVGGGPAGMEAARVLAERDFSVVLFEKEPELGGALNLADKPPHKELITRLTRTMERQLEVLGVDVRCGAEATPEMVRSLSPAAVFVAAGSTPIVPRCDGADRPNVHTAEDVVAGKVRLSGRVAVIGTGMTGLETAEMLGEAGCALVLVEMLPEMGSGVFAVIRNDILGRIMAMKPEVYTGHRLVSIGEGSIRMEKADGEVVETKVDHVVLSLGIVPRSDVVKAFEEVCGTVIPIGDADRTGRIYEATKDGFDKAYYFN
ncbi:MAG TPA: NADH:flavin oxidoreductase, partial [Synergistaceae bacterium]|nr:NADH:flavin oxidoreductase [Synergistaceae bacterium]